MNPFVLFTVILAFTGAALIFTQVRWFIRQDLTERLRPYEPGHYSPHSTNQMMPIREIVSAMGNAWASRITRLFGVQEELARRLERIHAPIDTGTFRARQASVTSLAGLVGIVLIIVLRPPPALASLVALGVPTTVFLLMEQQILTASDRWKARLHRELPVVAEQLGLLLGAGWSLNGAMARLAERGHGASGKDLARLTARVRNGVDERSALREWAALADIEPVNRLVAVLSLNREATDLGRLISEEARAIRRDLHRELIETMERRSQQVWIPVTVAALVPGALLIAIPFIHALNAFGTG